MANPFKARNSEAGKIKRAIDSLPSDGCLLIFNGREGYLRYCCNKFGGKLLTVNKVSETHRDEPGDFYIRYKE